MFLNKTLTGMNSFVDDYLKLLKCENFSEPSLENLTKLMEAQIETALFDCSVFFLKEPQKIILDDYLKVFDKLKKNTGAICFELNNVFKMLLTKLGYDVSLVSTKLFHYNEDSIPYYSLDVHCALLVNLKDKPYLVDVGWGSFRHPIPLNEPMKDASGTYKLQYDELVEKFAFYKLVEKENDWKLQYTFAGNDINPRDFRPNCNLIGSDEHHLTKKLLILQPGKDYSCIFLVGTKGEKLFFIEKNSSAILNKVELDNSIETRKLIQMRFGLNEERVDQILTCFFDVQHSNDIEAKNEKIFGIAD